jgi:hypothetical protein
MPALCIIGTTFAPGTFFKQHNCVHCGFSYHNTAAWQGGQAARLVIQMQTRCPTLLHGKESIHALQLECSGIQNAKPCGFERYALNNTMAGSKCVAVRIVT